MKLKNLLFVFFCLSFSGYSLAFTYYEDGNSLMPKIREYQKAQNNDPSANLSEAAEFRGYVVGVFEYLSLMEFACGGGVTKGQLGTVVARKMNNNPAQWNLPAIFLVAEALEESFPC